MYTICFNSSETFTTESEIKSLHFFNVLFYCWYKVYVYSNISTVIKSCDIIHSEKGYSWSYI